MSRNVGTNFLSFVCSFRVLVSHVRLQHRHCRFVADNCQHAVVSTRIGNSVWQIFFHSNYCVERDARRVAPRTAATVTHILGKCVIASRLNGAASATIQRLSYAKHVSTGSAARACIAAWVGSGDLSCYSKSMHLLKATSGLHTSDLSTIYITI